MEAYQQNGQTVPSDYQLPKTPERRLGKYAMMRLEYLRRHRRGTYTTYLTENRLTEHLWETEQKAKATVSEIISSMAQSQGLSEQMKAENPMLWVKTMNSLKASAEETVRHQLIEV